MACALICLLPSVGMLWASEAQTGETDLAEFPALIEDGTWNTDYMSELGGWFEDHFAYRDILVSANAVLRAQLLGDSVTDSVIVGRDGWLYYSETLDDYTGAGLLSDRAIDNIVFNLSIMQGYTQACGASFVVVIAPNKNSLYSEYMPYYYTEGGLRSLTLLEEAMEESGINFVSMYSVLSAQDEVLYYKKDTHWNTKGALIACTQLLSSLGNEDAAQELSLLTGTETQEFIGDLNTMLYLSSAKPETDYSFDDALEWTFVTGESTEDSEITTSGEGSGTLLMYRDSFANNMIPFLADVYETAYFTKMVPYDLTEVSESGAQAVIVERAERHLADLGTDAPIMPAPGVTLGISGDFREDSGVSDDGSVINIGTDGDYVEVSGILPEAYCDRDSAMYIGLEKEDGTVSWYVPFHLSSDSSDYGYEAHFYAATFEGTQRVYLAVSDADGTQCIAGMDADGADGFTGSDVYSDESGVL